MAHVRWLFQVFIRRSNVKDEYCVVSCLLSSRASLEAPPSRPQIVDQRPSSRGHQPLDLGTLDPLGLEMVPTAGNAPGSTSKGGPSCGVSGTFAPTWAWVSRRGIGLPWFWCFLGDILARYKVSLLVPRAAEDPISISISSGTAPAQARGRVGHGR
jgi:hypothetical protein